MAELVVFVAGGISIKSNPERLFCLHTKWWNFVKCTIKHSNWIQLVWKQEQQRAVKGAYLSTRKV